MIVQPFASAPKTGLAIVYCGLQTQDAATTWRRSRNEGPHKDSRSNGFGMLLMSPVVFSGWLVRFFESAYEPEKEKVPHEAPLDPQLQAVILAAEKIAEHSRLRADDAGAERHPLLDILQRRRLSGNRRVDERRGVEVVVAHQLAADLADVGALDQNGCWSAAAAATALKCCV